MSYKAVSSFNDAPIKGSKYQDIKLGVRSHIDKHRSVESSDPNILSSRCMDARVSVWGLCGWNDGGPVPPRVSIFKDFNALALYSNAVNNNLTGFLPKISRIGSGEIIPAPTVPNGNPYPLFLGKEERRRDLSTYQ